MWDKNQQKHWSQGLLAIAIFVAALLLRLPALSSFLTADETYALSTAFTFLSGLLKHDWSATVGLGYPGVSTSWLISAGLALKWVLARPSGFSSFAAMVEYAQSQPLDMTFVLWARIGLSLFAAAGTVLLWRIVDKLLGHGVALLAAALLLLDPILLGYSRLASPDAPMIFLLPLTWLLFLLAVQDKTRRGFTMSGIFLGLTLLTRISAVALLPPMLLLIVKHRWRERRGHNDWIRPALQDLLSLSLPALILFWVLWPAMWFTPAAALQKIAIFTLAMAGHGHELNNFWMGKVQTPNMLFYPAVTLWRTGAVTLIGLGLALFALRNARHRRPLAHILLFIVWYALILSLSPKKFDRYLFPVFPLIAIIAAAGWFEIMQRWLRNQKVWIVGAAALVFLQGAYTWNNLPSYVLAYNPMMGGLPRARQVLLVGWGEALSDTANFLNNHARSGQNHVAAWYGYNVFAPFYQGKTTALLYGIKSAEDAYDKDVDYVVTYINQMQRQLLDASLAQRLHEPLFSSVKDGVAIAQVYAWPKPFSHTTLQDVGPGLLLLGWEIPPIAPENGYLPVTLYWDVAAASQITPAPLHIWIKDASGEVWAQTTSAQPIASAQSVPAWLQHRARKQTIALTPPPGLMPGPYRVELAAEGGKTVLLETIEIPATAAAAVNSLQALSPPKPVLFDNKLLLAGYEISRPQKDSLLITLLWEAKQTPPTSIKSFIHIIDANDNIIAQKDGDLASLPGQTPISWSHGELIRQRWHLPLPANTNDQWRVYVGLYRADNGQRLPLTVGATPVPDARYALPDVSLP